MNKKLTAALALLMAVLLAVLTACNPKDGGKLTEFKTPGGIPDVNPEITITMKDGNVIKAVLYPAKAPNTVCNFLALVKAKYYNGLTFHRVMKDFMIQGGDAAGNGRGVSGFSINGEFSANGFEQNDIPFKEGTLAMARQGFKRANVPADQQSDDEKREAYNSAGTQFFIVDATSENNSLALDGNYAAFGEVTEGIEFVHEYARRNTRPSGDDMDKPYDLPYIKTITADTKGAEFPEPIIEGEVIDKDYVANPTTAPTTTAAPTTTEPPTTTVPPATTSEGQTTADPNEGRILATITMEDGGKIVIALYPEMAENTVLNFIDLVQNKFYDNVIFHRVSQNFVIQGGAKNGRGDYDPGWSIDGEFSENGHSANTLSYDAGVVGMARTGDPNSASTQFFIATTANGKDSLDGKYAAFGKVIEGMDVVRRMNTLVVEGGTSERPVNPPKMKTVRLTIPKSIDNIPAPVRNNHATQPSQ